MCKGFNRQYTQCGHIKEYVILSQCPFGMTTSNPPSPGTCDGPRQEILYTEMLESPSICRACYTAEEAFIFSVYADEIENINASMDDIREILRIALVLDDETRRELEAELVHLQESLDDAIADRTGALKAYRRSQGVWGDG